MNVNNLFDIFGLPINSTKDDITKRYKLLIKKLHPDKDNDKKSNEHFIKIKLIYEILIKYVETKDDYNIRKDDRYHNEIKQNDEFGNILSYVSEFVNDRFNLNLDLVDIYHTFVVT